MSIARRRGGGDQAIITFGLGGVSIGAGASAFVGFHQYSNTADTEAVADRPMPAMTILRMIAFTNLANITVALRDDGADVTGTVLTPGLDGTADSGAISASVAAESLVAVRVTNDSGGALSPQVSGYILVRFA